MISQAIPPIHKLHIWLRQISPMMGLPPRSIGGSVPELLGGMRSLLGIGV